MLIGDFIYLIESYFSLEEEKIRVTKLSFKYTDEWLYTSFDLYI